MSDKFTLQAQATTVPGTTLPAGSGCPSITIPILEQDELATKSYSEIDLTVDTPVVVPFGGVADAHVCIVTVANAGKATARITTADGIEQSIPVDDTLILISRSTPVTALDLTRVAGTDTKVKIFLGEKTS